MARTYDEMVTLVRNWSNRDVEALPDPIIQDSLRWAADKAYRRLRIPTLEHRLVYDSEMLLAATTNSNSRTGAVTELQIPPDLIEFIQLREIDQEGRTTRLFNEKADVRTFNDLYAEKYNDFAYWTRFQNCIQIAPGFNLTGTNFGSTGVGNPVGIELYYYRRLPALNARYDLTAANAGRGRLVVLTTDPMDMTTNNTDNAMTNTIFTNGTVNTETGVITPPTGENISYSDTMDTDNPNSVVVFSDLVPHWLREENERILLMGALAEVFFYLQENEEAQKYAALFTQEIQELNVEDQMRNSSGGNVQVNFNGRGLI